MLLQLSSAFRPKTNQHEELDLLLEIFAITKLAVECRNRDWMTAPRNKETLSFFRQRHTALFTVDAPESEHFTVMPFSDEVTNPVLAYWRFHGRNEKAYITGRNVPDRFDYDLLRRRTRKRRESHPTNQQLTQELHVVFNNNRSRFAPKAAAKLLQILEANRAARVG